jgi:hypothetical protein
MYAAAGGSTAVMRKLLARGADPAARDADGDSAVHWAAARGRADAIELLLSTGADLAAPNGGGKSPLALAIDCNRPEAHRTVALLLERGAPAEDALARAQQCESPSLQRVVLEGLANRAFRQSATPPALVALVWSSAETAAAAARWQAGLSALAASVTDLVQPATGFPRVLAASDDGALGPGFHVVIGMCTADEALARLALLRGLNADVRAVPVTMALPRDGCPLVMFGAQSRSSESVVDEAGRRLSLTSVRQERPGWSPHARFVAVALGADGQLLGAKSLVDFKYQRYCPQPSYEELFAKEAGAVRLILGCLRAEKDGRALGRVVDIYRWRVGAEGLAIDEVEKWKPD